MMMKIRSENDEISSNERLRILFVDDEPAKVDELLEEINAAIVDIIPFEPFYSLDETYRDVLAQRPDVILMDHGLAQGVKGDKVLQELVSRGYKGRFITNTGGNVSENFRSVMGIRNGSGERVIIDHANKNPKLLRSILSGISSDISLILDEDRIDIITRRSIKDKLLDTQKTLSDLNQDEADFIIRIFGAGDKNKELRLSLMLNTIESNMDMFENLSNAEKKIMISEAKRLVDAGIIPEDSALISFFPKEEEKQKKMPNFHNQKKNLTQSAKEDGYDSLGKDEKVLLLEEIRKCRFGLGSFLKIKHIDVYSEILQRFSDIDDYEKKSILEEMINEDYALYSNAASPVFDSLDIQGFKDDIAMLIMLKNPKKGYPKEFKLFGEYFSIEMGLAMIYLTAYSQGADLPDTLLGSLWENRERILDFDARYEAVGPKAIIALMSFPMFEKTYSGIQKQKMIEDVSKKWRNRGKLSFIRKYNDLTGSNQSTELDISTVKQFGDYDMDEIYEDVLNKRLILDKECMIEFIKRQLVKGAYSNVEKLFAGHQDLDIGIIGGTEMQEYIKEYIAKNMIGLLLDLIENNNMRLDESAKRHITDTYPGTVVQIAMEKGDITKIADILNISGTVLTKAAADSYLKNFNFHLLGKLKRYEGKNEEHKKLYIISEMY